jgi:hypothetical protein
MIYAAHYDTMNGLVDFLTENCCAGASCAPAAVCKPVKASQKNQRKEVA